MIAVLQNQKLERTAIFNGKLMGDFIKTEHTKVPQPNHPAPFLENILVSAEVAPVTQCVERLPTDLAVPGSSPA